MSDIYNGVYDDVTNPEPDADFAARTSQLAYDRDALEKIRDSAPYRSQRAEFRTQCAKAPDEIGTGGKGLRCWLCTRAIDYSLKYPHPESWSLDHAKTVKEAPELIMDIGNWRSSHLDCNQRRGTDEPFLDIGEPSEVW